LCGAGASGGSAAGECRTAVAVGVFPNGDTQILVTPGQRGVGDQAETIVSLFAEPTTVAVGHVPSNALNLLGDHVLTRGLEQVLQATNRGLQEDPVLAGHLQVPAQGTGFLIGLEEFNVEFGDRFGVGAVDPQVEVALLTAVHHDLVRVCAGHQAGKGKEKKGDSQHRRSSCCP
jgi:hypothetical protein